MSGGHPIERRLRGLQPAGPSPGLERRVLAAAVAAPPARPPSWSDRLWFSPAPRLAWLSAILALLILQLLSDRSLDRRIEEAFGKAETGERSVVAELARELDVRTVWRYRPAAASPPSRSRTAGEPGEGL